MILRELLLKLGLDVDEAKFAKGQLAAAALEAGLSKIVDVGKEMVSKFLEVVQETANAGHELEHLAQVTGIGTQELQNLTAAATASGVSAEDVAGGLRILSREMYAAKNGSEESGKSFARLGVKVKGTDGKLRSANEVFLDLADRFSKMPDGAEKTAQAMAVLGRNGASLIPVLNKGRDGVAELAAQFPNLTEEQIKAGAELVSTQKQIVAITKSLWQQAIAPLLPAINDLLKRYLAWRKENAALMAQKIRQYIGYLITGVNVLARTFRLLVDNSRLVSFALMGLGVALLAFNAVSIAVAAGTAVAWALAAAPFILLAGIIAGIFLLFDDLRTYQQDQEKGSKKQHSMFGIFKKQLDGWMQDNPKDPWWLRSIKAFVKHINDAIKLIQEFDDLINGKGPAVSDPNKVNKFSPEWKQKNTPLGPLTRAQEIQSRVDTGRFVSAEDRAFLAVSGASPAAPSFMPTAQAPEYRPAGGVSSAPMMTQQNIFSIVQQPGEDGEALATRVAEKVVESHWQSRMQEASASVP
jgi:hypothetical protein